jgi:hypothetical protein
VTGLARRGAQLAVGLLVAVAAALGLGALTSSPASADPCPPAYAPPFTDVPVDHPFCTEILTAKTHGAIDGKPDGSFGPTESVERGEVAAILYNAATAESGGFPLPCPGGPFVDVPMYHHFCKEIWLIAGAGIMDGFADGTFRPADPITRGAVAAVLTRFPDGPLAIPACVGAAFPDVPAANVFCPHIQVMSFIGVVNGFADGTFRPNSDVTRQEFVAMLIRWIEYLDT